MKRIAITALAVLIACIPAQAVQPAVSPHGISDQQRAFCKKNPRFCKPVTGVSRVAVGSGQWRTVVAVDRQVNASITPVDDAKGTDVWTLLPNGGQGDCEDFALTKIAKLTARGIPRNALRLTWVVKPSGEGHMIAVVLTDKGPMVLDNPWVDSAKPNPYTQRLHTLGQTDYSVRAVEDPMRQRQGIRFSANAFKVYDMYQGVQLARN